MKNSILIAVLVASLALNGWLAFARSSRFSAASAAENARAVAARAKQADAAKAAKISDAKTDAPAQPFVWNTRGNSNDDLRQLAANLRAAGFPPEVIVKVVGALLRERVYAKVAELPFWQLNSNNREMRKRQTEAGRELLRLQEDILGASGSQLATLDPGERRARYGDLPDDKVAALLKIDRDYQDMMSEIAPSGPTTSEEGKALMEQFKTLQSERLADVKAALGEEAYADYERQSSSTAALVMRGLRELKVTEEEYNALFAAQKARDPNESGVFFSGPNAMDATKLAATYAFNDQVRAVLGDERAHTYLKSADSAYAQVARFAEQQSGLTPAVTYQLYQLQNEARATLRQVSQRSAGAPVDVEQMRKTFTELNARLETLVGPEVAKAYRAQGNGSVFRNFVRSSAPAGGETSTNSGSVTPPKG